MTPRAREIESHGSCDHLASHIPFRVMIEELD
jgi:hypothetical protein